MNTQPKNLLVLKPFPKLRYHIQVSKIFVPTSNPTWSWLVGGSARQSTLQYAVLTTISANPTGKHGTKLSTSNSPWSKHDQLITGHWLKPEHRRAHWDGAKLCEGFRRPPRRSEWRRCRWWSSKHGIGVFVYNCKHVYQYVPHKAVAEVLKIGNL